MNNIKRMKIEACEKRSKEAVRANFIAFAVICAVIRLAPYVINKFNR